MLFLVLKLYMIQTLFCSFQLILVPCNRGGRAVQILRADLSTSIPLKKLIAVFQLININHYNQAKKKAEITWRIIQSEFLIQDL